MDPILAQIMGFGGNFAPRGWAFCEGQLLPISQNSALFSLLGTTYGGNGTTTFALPDLRGRSIVHPGAGPGLTPVTLGEMAGAEAVTLTIANLPPHSHTASLHAETALADQQNPNNRMLALGQFYADVVPTEDRTMAPESIRVASVGNGIPVAIRSPFLAVNMIIAMVGIYPSRS